MRKILNVDDDQRDLTKDNSDVSEAQLTPTVTIQQPVAVRQFAFDGGAGSYFGVSLGAFLLTLVTLGFATPWAVCMRYRWRTNHTYVQGHRLRFTGTGGGLFGNWIKWWLLCIVTVGIYSFWVVPRLTKWIVEHQEFDPTWK